MNRLTGSATWSAGVQPPRERVPSTPGDHVDSPFSADAAASSCGVSSGCSGDYSVRAFGVSEWPTARAMLLAGYPDTPAALWDAGFQRLLRVPPAPADAPLGVLLRRRQQVVGVALMLPSRRPGAAGATDATDATDDGATANSTWHVNASSWAILPDSRSRALWMARCSMASTSAVFSALTPIPSAVRLLQRVGFEPVSHQCVLGATPRLRQAAGAGARVLSGAPALAALRDHALAPALRDHHQLGCLVMALETAGGLVPLVWRAKRRLRGLPTAELLYAASQAQVAAHVGALARHLLLRGYMLLEFEAQQDLVPDFACTRLFQRRFARGPYAAAGVDRLYSELVYLHR